MLKPHVRRPNARRRSYAGSMLTTNAAPPCSTSTRAAPVWSDGPACVSTCRTRPRTAQFGVASTRCHSGTGVYRTPRWRRQTIATRRDTPLIDLDNLLTRSYAPRRDPDHRRLPRRVRANARRAGRAHVPSALRPAHRAPAPAHRRAPAPAVSRSGRLHHRPRPGLRAPPRPRPRRGDGFRQDPHGGRAAPLPPRGQVSSARHGSGSPRAEVGARARAHGAARHRAHALELHRLRTPESLRRPEADGPRGLHHQPRPREARPLVASRLLPDASAPGGAVRALRR